MENIQYLSSDKSSQVISQYFDLITKQKHLKIKQLNCHNLRITAGMTCGAL